MPDVFCTAREKGGGFNHQIIFKHRKMRVDYINLKPSDKLNKKQNALQRAFFQEKHVSAACREPRPIGLTGVFGENIYNIAADGFDGVFQMLKRLIKFPSYGAA